jgi:pimeloyl-ACP methyl ester carboxylesterase
MGGFAAAQTLAARKGVKGLILMDMWNPGPGGREAALSGKTAGSLAILGRGLPPLSGTSAQALTDELMASHVRFDVGNHAAAMADRPVLLMAATKGLVADSRALETRLRAAGAGSVSFHEWPTDHSFSDHRIKLTTTTLEWLSQFETKR